MKAGIEIFIGLILMTMMTLVCVNFISADLGVMQAREDHAQYISEIQNGYFSDAVINDCEKDAESKNYTLDVKTSYVGRSKVAYVSLTYDYKLPLLNINKEHVIYGIAR